MYNCKCNELNVNNVCIVYYYYHYRVPIIIQSGLSLIFGKHRFYKFVWVPVSYGILNPMVGKLNPGSKYHR
jgi:hypothetical protein